MEQSSRLLNWSSANVHRRAGTKAHLLATVTLLLACTAGTWNSRSAPLPVLKRSDVVFMNQAPQSVYEAYGATALAWGGTPKRGTSERTGGLKYFGSVGMVTEFARYYERFTNNYAQGLCRDPKGEPFKVPWLTDHQHKGVPFWWCCTRQPLFRQYISERVVETVKGGADGVHIDDHLGTAGALSVDGGCFCKRCVSEFRPYLQSLPAGDTNVTAAKASSTYDYAQVLRDWLAEVAGRKVTQHPLWNRWREYQLRGAAAFMAELRELAARTAGKPVPMSANACLMWGPHLNDYRSLDYFSAEIEHHASQKGFNDEPLAAYRIAEAVNRPLAATASGGDWAFIKENNLPGLVQGWIALSYAAGNCLMAPNRQWCYTPEKGTHWYDGPQTKFAPLYQFVRRNADLFDDYETFPDLVVVYAQRTFDRDRAKFTGVCHRLAAANISFRLALGGDAVVEHPLAADDFRGGAPVLTLEPQDFEQNDKLLLDTLPASRKLTSLDSALQQVVPAARLTGEGQFRVLPRVKPGSAVIHLVNWKYDPSLDAVGCVTGLRVELNLGALGLKRPKQAKLFTPERSPLLIDLQGNTLALPETGLWAVIEIKGN